MDLQYLTKVAKLYPFYGNEKEAIDDVKQFFGEIGQVIDDEELVYPVIKISGKNSTKNIALITYLDESGFLVQDYLEKGFISFSEYGEIDKRSLTAQEVLIFGKEQYFGLIGNKPSHYLTEEDKKASVDIARLFIDTGYIDKDDIKTKIRIGDFIGLRSFPKVMKNNTVVSHGLSDKIGSVTTLEVAKNLKVDGANDDVYIFTIDKSSQGRRQIVNALRKYNIDVAIITDSTKTHMVENNAETVYLGQGPTVLFGGGIDYGLSKLATKAATGSDISVQPVFLNFDEEEKYSYIYFENNGYPCTVISVPVENKGTSNEICKVKDVEATGKLIEQLIRNI